jgi:RNA polymerase sigma-70 factor (subfamily 1)
MSWKVYSTLGVWSPALMQAGRHQLRSAQDGVSGGSVAPEAALLARALKGDTHALDRLLLTLSPRLMGRIERRLPADLRSVFSAEDVLQEVLTDAYSTFSTFIPNPEAPTPVDAAYGWLTTIADHRLIDLVRYHRAQKRGPGQTVQPRPGLSMSMVALVDLLAIDSHTPSRSYSDHELEAAIQSAVTRLTPDHRAAIQMRYFEGLSIAQIAARMTRSEHAVHNLTSRAVGNLRECLDSFLRYLPGQ